MKCNECANNIYRTQQCDIGCKDGKACWYLHTTKLSAQSEQNDDIPFKIEPLKTQFSEIGKTPLEIEIGVNLALKRGCKLIVNNSTYIGFKCFHFDLSKHTINVFNDNVMAEIEFYEESNIIVSYGRETVKLTIEAL